MEHLATAPSPWIVRFAHLLPVAGDVLDLACGSGRHARWLAARGHSVLAVDRDEAALGPLAGVSRIETRAADLELAEWPLGSRRFAGVVVTNYLWRPRLAEVVAAVDAGGVLLYETFARGNEAFGRPSNPEFLLRPGELLGATRDQLEVVAYEHGRVEGAHGARVVQRIAAIRGSAASARLAPESPAR